MRVIARPLRTGPVCVDASTGSQFASALALVAPRIGGLTIRLTGTHVVSRPYVRLTVAVLRDFGIQAALDLEARCLDVPAGVPRHDGPYPIEPDASAAAAWYCATALAGGDVVVPGVHRTGLQADLAVLPLLARMGATVTSTPAGCRVQATGARLAGLGPVDLRDATDLVPLVAALAATAQGPTIIRGAGHARRKESDRLARMARSLSALGADVTLDEDDTLTLRGGTLRGGTVSVGGDHRLAFAFAVLGLKVPGVTLMGHGAVRKSDPTFFDTLRDAVSGGPPL